MSYLGPDMFLGFSAFDSSKPTNRSPQHSLCESDRESASGRSRKPRSRQGF